jgi:signal transduction histidine kinase
VNVVDEDTHAMRRVAVFAASAETQAAAAVLQRDAPEPESADVIVEVFRTGTPRVLPDVTDAELGSIARSPGDLGVLRAIAPRSLMLVPLAARGRTLGVLSLVSTQTARRYGPEDLVFAQDVSGRAALALDNARLYREAQETDRRKDRFLAVLAHELRNPLAPIVTAMGIIRHHEGANPAIQRARAIVERQLAYQARLLDDLLDLSRIGRDKVEVRRRPVDLRGLLYDVLDTVGPTLRERNLRVELEMPGEPIVLMADPTRLEQVFVNLLENAAKYTAPGGTIGLGATVHERTAVVRVWDTGIGIAPDMLGRVFDLFAQGATTSLRREGLGIGLALVRRFVELHDGTVEAHSEGVGRGAEFVVRLPLGVPDAE